MALPSWANDTVTRIRPGTKDVRGSIVPDWTKSTSENITGCSMQPAATALSQDGRVLGISEGYTGYFPPGTDITAGDKIQFDGNDYQIIGEPRPWKSPTGRVTHIQAQLERWSG